MSDLAFITLICGALVFVWSAGMALWPRGMAALIGAFPRHVWAGRILAAVDILWSAWLLLQMRFAWVDAHHIMVYAAVPVAYVMVILFVDNLLADGVKVPQSAGARVLRDIESSVAEGLHDWIADIGEVRHLPPPGVISSGGLCATFKNMAGDRARGQAIPIIFFPTELANHGS